MFSQAHFWLFWQPAEFYLMSQSSVIQQNCKLPVTRGLLLFWHTLITHSHLFNYFLNLRWNITHSLLKEISKRMTRGIKYLITDKKGVFFFISALLKTNVQYRWLTFCYVTQMREGMTSRKVTSLWAFITHFSILGAITVLWMDG